MPASGVGFWWAGKPLLYDHGDGEDNWTAGYTSDPAKVSRSKNSDHLYINVFHSEDLNQTNEGAWDTVEQIDVTDVDIIEIDWEGTEPSGAGSTTEGIGHLALQSAQQQDAFSADVSVTRSLPFARATDQLDVSAHTGLWYVAIHLRCTNANQVHYDFELMTYRVERDP